MFCDFIFEFWIAEEREHYKLNVVPNQSYIYYTTESLKNEMTFFKWSIVLVIQLLSMKYQINPFMFVWPLIYATSCLLVCYSSMPGSRAHMISRVVCA